MLNSLHKISKYRGRFAPSPSGALHFGSLLAATASYLDAKAHQGDWLLRIDDLDAPRVQQGAISSIINTLEQHGFEWDESILYQSQRLTAYQTIIKRLLEDKYAYFCSCSRKTIQKTAQLGSCGFIYAGHCRQGLYQIDSPLRSVRLYTKKPLITFTDRIQGYHQQCIATEIGDFVLKRSDGVFAYQLAVVVDDHYQGITDSVRGYDLLDNTARQLYLQQLLNYPKLRYLHIPVATDKYGNKLSKRNHAQALNNQHSFMNMHHALVFLGQNPPAPKEFSQLSELWQWAIMHWDINTIPKQSKQSYERTQSNLIT